MGVVYRSRTSITRLGGSRKVRRAEIPVDPPIHFGFHDEIAEHYGHEGGAYEPHAATLDYVVAAAGS
jgi:hypothetical protein